MMLQVLFAAIFIQAGAEYVTIHDLTSDQSKRNLDLGLPDVTRFRLDYGAGEMTLNLRENKGLNAYADIYEPAVDEFGRVRARKVTAKRPFPRARFYQAQDNFAYVMITCERTVFGPCTRTLKGNVLIKGREHSLSPASTEAERRSMEEKPDGTPHILELVEQEYADSAFDYVISGEALSQPKTENIANGKDESLRAQERSILKTILRRMNQRNLHETQSSSHRPLDQLPSQQGLEQPMHPGIDDADVTDDNVKTPKNLDKGSCNENDDDEDDDTLTEAEQAEEKALFERVLKQMKGSHRHRREATLYTVELLIVIDYAAYLQFSATSSGDVNYDIREYISHIINGVDYRYKTITDPDYAFSVTISGFYIVTSSSSTSNWTGPPGSQADAYDAIDDFTNWLNVTSGLPDNDHAALLTGNDLVADGSSNIIGLAQLSGVCGPFRIHVGELWGLYTGAVIFAHELGHNVGSCLLNEGVYWDKPEWDAHTDELPGEHYTLDEQCHLLAGSDFSFKSDYENTPKMCRNFLCSDGARTFAFVAALGAPCGSNQWCIEGLCVPKSECEDSGVDGEACEALEATTNNEDFCFQYFSECCATCRAKCWSNEVVVGSSRYFCDSLRARFGRETVCQMFPFNCCKMCLSYF